MKKVMLLAISLFILVCGSVSAHGTMASEKKSAGLTIKVNGVEVKSAANHVTAEGKTYVSVRAFADLFGRTFTLSKGNKEVVFSGVKISNIRIKQDEPTAWIQDLAKAVHAQQVSWDGKQEVYVLALPEGTIKISETVPAMGEHWSNPKAGDLPTGPIYGVHDGKLVFIEYMVAQDDFIKGINHTNVDGMKGVPSPAVEHVDIEFQEHGHEGFEVPHYDIHAYFITREEQQKIK